VSAWIKQTQKKVLPSFFAHRVHGHFQGGVSVEAEAVAAGAAVGGKGDGAGMSCVAPEEGGGVKRELAVRSRHAAHESVPKAFIRESKP